MGVASLFRLLLGSKDSISVNFTGPTWRLRLRCTYPPNFTAFYDFHIPDLSVILLPFLYSCISLLFRLFYGNGPEFNVFILFQLAQRTTGELITGKK
jgi:hypothetical protein